MSITPSTRDYVINHVCSLFGAVLHTNLVLYFIVLIALSMNPTFLFMRIYVD